MPFVHWTWIFLTDLWFGRGGAYFWRSCVEFIRLQSCIINTSVSVKADMTLFAGFIQLGAGLSVGLAGLAAGFAIGIVGDAGVRGTAQQPRLFVGMVRNPFLT